jgi:hypothetical protein
MSFRGDHDPRDRAKFDWSATDEYNQRERPHDGMYLDRSRHRPGSPWGNWSSDLRDRSRSPRNRQVKSSFIGRGPPDDYADPYISRGMPNNLEAGPMAVVVVTDQEVVHTLVRVKAIAVLLLPVLEVMMATRSS